MGIAGIGFDGVMVAGLGVENSCDDRQGQGFGCRIYFVSYQNKRFNTHRQRAVGAVLLEYLVYRNL